MDAVATNNNENVYKPPQDPPGGRCGTFLRFAPNTGHSLFIVMNAISCVSSFGFGLVEAARKTSVSRYPVELEL
jgi:hypothetical protein